MTDLKLLALDAEDLEVISATTQDAVIRVGDMGYARADKRFALLMNRFAWEADGKQGQRKRAALHFDRVESVKAAGINLEAVEGVLELLAIRYMPEGEGPDGVVELFQRAVAKGQLALACAVVQLNGQAQGVSQILLQSGDVGRSFLAGGGLGLDRLGALGGAAGQPFSDGQGPDASRMAWAFAARQFRA